MNEDIYQKSLEFHREHRGKLEVVSKVPLNSKEVLSLAYTPGVAEVCREIARDPSLAREYTLKRNTIAIVSDGSAILGLGNLGALASIPVMEGKAAIFKEFAGVDAFPICLDTQDNEEIIKAVKQLAPVFGGINLEDIAGPRCFEIEERLRKELSIPVMHDDQWGAATVTLAGLINSLKLAGKTKENVRVVLSGIGAAGVATARLMLIYGIKNIVYIDSKGIIHADRDDLTKEKEELLEGSTAKPAAGSLLDAMVGADVFIGLSKPGVLTEEMVRSMNEKPIIFGLANPTPEIMPDVAKVAGAFIVATGRSDFPNQLNNSLVFPGAFKGMLEANIPQFKIEMFSAIAQALADSVTDISTEKIVPSMFDKNVVTLVSNTIQKFK
ncbi:MAG: NADP-dependent malic enzyme [Candidatus Pacebacteria bacterium]|nr:NADP-dependent malic enzyme [Candidatus Paceibacterota bacterium]